MDLASEDTDDHDDPDDHDESLLMTLMNLKTPIALMTLITTMMLKSIH